MTPYADDRPCTLRWFQLFTGAGVFGLIVCPAAAWWLQWQGTFTPSRLRNIIRVVFLLASVPLAGYLAYIFRDSGEGNAWVGLGLLLLFTAVIAFFVTFAFIWLWLRVALGPSRWVGGSR